MKEGVRIAVRSVWWADHSEIWKNNGSWDAPLFLLAGAALFLFLLAVVSVAAAPSLGALLAAACSSMAARAPLDTRKSAWSATTDMLLAACLASFCRCAICKTPLASGRTTFSSREMLAYCSAAGP